MAGREPVRIGEKARSILAGIFLRQHKTGIRFRSKEKKVEDILAMVRKEFPNAVRRELVGDILDFLKVERSEDECAYYSEMNRCPWECGNEGKLWVVQQKDSRSGPVYVVGYQMCGRYRAWQEKKRQEKESKYGTPEFATSFTARSSQS